MVVGEKDIKYLFPVINREGYIDDVAVAAIGLEDFNNEKLYLSYRANIFICIFMVIGVLAAFFYFLYRCAGCQKNIASASEYERWISGTDSVEGLWKETGSIVNNINDIFAKAQLLEESRQEFVSNVSHELKTPITSMKVLSESILMQENVPVETYREFMNDIALK